MVLAVNCPPQAPAPGQAWSSTSLNCSTGDLPGIVGADRLEDVLDGQVAVGERAGGAHAASEHDGPAVQHEPGHIDASEHHGHRGDGLVAPGDGDEAVEHVAPRDELDGVGDDLAADERALHALGAHRDAVGDRDRIDLDGSAARRPHPCITFSASFLWFQLQGIVPIQLWATPICGRLRSSSENPTAFIMARAAERSVPSRRTRLFERGSTAIFGSPSGT